MNRDDNGVVDYYFVVSMVRLMYDPNSQFISNILKDELPFWISSELNSIHLFHTTEVGTSSSSD